MRWLYGLAEAIIIVHLRSGAPTVALGHRPERRSIAPQAVVGMVDVVLRTSMSSRYQALAGTHHPDASGDPTNAAFQWLSTQ